MICPYRITRAIQTDSLSTYMKSGGFFGYLFKFNKKRFISSGCCRCKNCFKELSTGLGLIKCSNCGSMQPPPPTQASPRCCPNYYGLLVPECPDRPRFRIDLKALKREYLKLQAQVHPDKMQGVVGTSWSSWINRANETLKNPLQRAIYLLNLLYERDSDSLLQTKNEDEEKEKIYNSDNPDSSDTHDISLVLEVRESIAETTSPSGLLKIKQQNDARIEDCCCELEIVLDGDGDGGRNDFEGARRCINKLRYWMSIDEELKRRE